MADENTILLYLKALDQVTPVMVEAVKSMQQATTQMAQAVEKMSGGTKKNEEETTKWSAAVTGVNQALELGKKAIDLVVGAYQVLSQQVGIAIDEAIEAERAQNKLTGALVSTGQYSEKAAESLNLYVQAVEASTGVSGEFIQTAIATGVQMGLTTQQAQGLEEAARKLAATQGIDLNSALSMLQGSLNGQSKALAKVLPQVKDLTAEQLKNGGAIGIVNKALEAQYGLHLQSYEAALGKAKNALSNVYEEVGKVIINNKALTSVISSVGDIFGDLQKYVEDNRAAIARFITSGVLMAVDALGTLALSMDTVIKIFRTVLQVLAIPMQNIMTLSMAAAQAVSGNFKGAFETIKSTVTGTIDEVKNAFTKDTMFVGIADKIADVRAKAEEASNRIAANEESNTSKKLESDSKKIASNQMVAASYGDILLNTEKQKKAEELEISVRDKQLKDFQSFLDAKKRLALTADEEELLQVQTHMAAITADTEFGRQQQLQLRDAQFQADMAQKLAQAEALGMSDMERLELSLELERNYNAQKIVEGEDYLTQRIAQADRERDYRKKQSLELELNQKKHGMAMGTLQSVADSSQLNGMKQVAETTSQLMASKNKTAFEIGKKAAIANATIQMYQSAVGAFNAMVGIPFIGPALAVAAAGAAIAAGTVQIANINSQKFNAGGQADSGMDSVPQNLGGKSFILSAGERVVQPTANKDLTEFLNKEKLNNQAGARGGGNNYNVTLNYSGNGSQDDARKMAEMVVAQIREMSERGTPIMSEKGIVKK